MIYEINIHLIYFIIQKRINRLQNGDKFIHMQNIALTLFLGGKELTDLIYFKPLQHIIF